jgi:type IV pilus assembly protein PilO
MDLQNARTQRMVLAGIGAAAILYLYFFSTFLPFGHRAVAADRAALEQEYRQLSADLSKARQTLNNLAEVERQYEILTQRWQVAAELLPEEKEVAELLRKVTLVGQQSGVEFLLFRPKSVVAGELYNENPVEVKVLGGYHQVGSFLAEVANLDRIVNVSNLALTANSDEEAQRQTVEALFVATAYTLNPNAPPPAQAEPDPGAVRDSKEGESEVSAKGAKMTDGGTKVEKGAKKAPKRDGGKKNES